MLKIAYSQVLRDWKAVVGVMLALFATAVLLTTFITLGGTAIIDRINNVDGSVATTIIFNAITGVTLLIAALAISVTAIQSIRRRHKQFMMLRIIGSTYGQIRGVIFTEIVMLMVIAFLIGSPIGLFVANPIASYLVDQKALTATFNVRNEWYFPFISFGISLFIAFFVAAITIRDFRFVSLTGRKVPSKRGKIVQILIGFAALVGGIGYLLARTFEEGGVDSLALIVATITFAIAMMVLGPYAIRFILKKMANVTRRRPLLSMALSSSSFSVAQLITPIVVIASGVLIVASTSVFSNASTKALAENNGPLYVNIKSGLDLRERDVSIKSDLSEFNQNNPAQKTFISEISEVYSQTTDGNLTVRALQGSAPTFAYGLKNVDGDPTDVFKNPANAIVQNSIAKKGTSLELAIDGTTQVFNVVATYDRPFKNGSGADSLLPGVFLNYANPSVRASPVLSQIALVVSLDESLKPLASTYTAYDPYFSVQFAANVTSTASLLFGISFGVFVAVMGINAIAIYVTDRRKAFKTARIVSHTLADVWRQVFFEWLIFAGIVAVTVALYLLMFGLTFSKSNLIDLSGSDAGQLVLIVFLGLLLSLLSYFGSMLAINKKIAKINVSSQ